MGKKGKHRQKKGKSQQKNKKANNKKQTQQNKPRPAKTDEVPPVEKQEIRNEHDVREEGNIRPIGLTNLKNTCYFNSVLQILLSSAFFQEVFANEDRSPFSTLTRTISQVFKAAAQSNSKQAKFSPHEALAAIRAVAPVFKSKSQHDAHELLIALLHHLSEESVVETEDSMTSNWMADGFSGMLESKITCLNCGFTKSRKEDFLVLNVSVMRETEIEAEQKSNGTSNGLVSRPLSTMELPDVVERIDSDTMQHLQPASEPSSSTQNNSVDEKPSDGVEQDGAQSENLWDVLTELQPDEYLSENFNGLRISEEGDPEENEFVPANSKGKKKKKKGKKKSNRFEGFDFGIEESPAVKIKDDDRFKTLDECLYHFFSPELVTWRCSKENPEKKVSFSEEPPEVFVLPPSKESRVGKWQSYLGDEDLSSYSDEETGPSGKEDLELSAEKVDGLKSCIRAANGFSPEIPTGPPLNSTKQYFLWRAPRVLCISLKRFEAANHRRISKLGHHVEFDLNLDLSAFFDAESVYRSDVRYELRGVVCHTGGATFGHYTAYASRRVGEKTQWFSVSDAEVRKATASDVLASQAYILLFETQELSVTS